MMDFWGSLAKSFVDAAATVVDIFVPALAPIVSAVAAVITTIVNNVTSNSGGSSGNASRSGGSAGSGSSRITNDFNAIRDQAHQRQIDAETKHFDQDYEQISGPKQPYRPIPTEVGDPAAMRCLATHAGSNLQCLGDA